MCNKRQPKNITQKVDNEKERKRIRTIRLTKFRVSPHVIKTNKRRKKRKAEVQLKGMGKKFNK